MEATVSGSAFTIKRFRETIPPHRIEALLDILREYYGRQDISESDIDQACELGTKLVIDSQCHGDKVVGSLKDIPAFIIS
jgi:hypothetical protein